MSHASTGRRIRDESNLSQLGRMLNLFFCRADILASITKALTSLHRRLIELRLSGMSKADTSIPARVRWAACRNAATHRNDGWQQEIEEIFYARLEINLWDYLTFLVLFLGLVAFLVVVVFVLGLLGRIAIARGHREADALNIMGWVDFVTVVPWIQAHGLPVRYASVS